MKRIGLLLLLVVLAAGSVIGAPDIPAPIITSVNPAEGTKDGGTEVSIQGSFHQYGISVLRYLAIPSIIGKIAHADKLRIIAFTILIKILKS